MATLATLHEANKVVELAIKGINDVHLKFPVGWIESKVGVLTVTDASFSGEAGLKSQQGRVHFLASLDDLKDIGCTTFKVYPIGFSSTTISSEFAELLCKPPANASSGQEAGH